MPAQGSSASAPAWRGAGAVVWRAAAGRASGARRARLRRASEQPPRRAITTSSADATAMYLRANSSRCGALTSPTLRPSSSAASGVSPSRTARRMAQNAPTRMAAVQWMNIGRFAGSSVIFRNASTSASVGFGYTTGMLKYFIPAASTAACSSAARCSDGCRRLSTDFTPSALSLAKASRRGWPPVQNCGLTCRNFGMAGSSVCAGVWKSVASRRNVSIWRL